MPTGPEIKPGKGAGKPGRRAAKSKTSIILNAGIPSAPIPHGAAFGPPMKSSDGPKDSGSRLAPENVDQWKGKYFPQGSRARAKFEYLCHVGCDPRFLLSFLTLAVFSANFKRTIYDQYEVSKSALTNLPDRLDEIGRDLRGANRLLGDYLQGTIVSDPQISKEIRVRGRKQVSVYQNTPELLRILATDLRAANAWVTKHVGPRRHDTFRQSVLKLIQYVDTCTNSPHYNDVSELLEHLFSVQEKTFRDIDILCPLPKRTKQKKNGVPLLVESPDALKALYRHSAKYGFRKARPLGSKPRSA